MNAFRHNRRLDPPGPKPFVTTAVALLFLVVLVAVVSQLNRASRRQPPAPPPPPAAGPVEPAPQARPGEWTEDYADALAAAKLDGRPVLLCFERSDSSPASDLLRRELFEAEDWKAWAASNVFLLRVDFLRNAARQDPKTRAVNEVLAREFKVEQWPSLLLLGADGHPIARPEVRRGAPPAFYIRQIAVARFEADPAALRAALGDAKADDYFATKAALDDYSARVEALRRDLNESAARARAAVAAAADDAARAAAQEELNRVVGEKARAYRACQEGGLEAAREGLAKLEAYRDELVGVGGAAVK